MIHSLIRCGLKIQLFFANGVSLLVFKKKLPLAVGGHAIPIGTSLLMHASISKECSDPHFLAIKLYSLPLYTVSAKYSHALKDS
jgi:hypothetical protein